MHRQTISKQILYFIAGSFINLALFCLTKYTAFPFWLDYTGSFFITALIGPVAGFLSAFLHTALLIILIDGYAAMLPFLPALSVCVIIWFAFNTEVHDRLRLISGSAFATVTAFLCNSIIFICCPDMYGRYAQYSVILESYRECFGRFFGSIMIAASVTLPELILSLTVFWLIYLISPKRTDKLTFKK